MGLREARAQFGDLVNQAQYARKSTIVTRHGRPAAMIVPVPQYIALRDITVDYIDRADQREQAIANWIEAAASEGHGFTVVATYDQGDVLAVVARDDWSDLDEMKLGERMTLRIDRTGSQVEPGEGDLFGLAPAPYDAEQHPVATSSAPADSPADSSDNLGERANILVPEVDGLVAADRRSASGDDSEVEVERGAGSPGDAA